MWQRKSVAFARSFLLVILITGGSLRASADGQSQAGIDDLYIPREQVANSATISFERWLKHFANPVVCNMIFCHSSCADYDDACPSFRHHLLTILDHRSCMNQGSQVLRMAPPAENCCVDNLGSAETFSHADSPFK